MTGELSGKSPAPESSSEGSKNCLDLLKKLGRDEILELLSQDFCTNCHSILESRVQTLVTKKVSEVSRSNNNIEGSESWSRRSHKQESTHRSFPRTPESTYSSRQRGFPTNYSPELVSNKRSSENSKFDILLNDGLSRVPSSVDNVLRLSEEQKENIRILQVGRKKDFVHIERIDGIPKNVLKGLELHTQVFNTEEQKEIVEFVYDLRKMGQKGQLRERTYSEPRKWMRGKGRVTIQFGCCYNYAVDKNGNPPGIIRDEDVDPLPYLFKKMIKRMVRWNILPPTCIPNSCIVNIYEQGDCIPPHIDHHDFVRPFCTVSFLTECNILFGSNLKIVGPGEFSGPVSVPLPVGSVLILSGNGADIAKHCVPGVPAKRISITFRKMDDSKLPYRFRLDPELRGIKPLSESSIQHDGHQKPLVSTRAVQQNEHQDGHRKPLVSTPLAVQQNEHLDSHQKPLTPLTVQQNEHQEGKVALDESDIVKKMSSNSFLVEKDDFPPLGNSSATNRFRNKEARSKQRIV